MGSVSAGGDESGRGDYDGDSGRDDNIRTFELFNPPPTHTHTHRLKVIGKWENT